jgi:hypothetical protein
MSPSVLNTISVVEMHRRDALESQIEENVGISYSYVAEGADVLGSGILAAWMLIMALWTPILICVALGATW